MSPDHIARQPHPERRQERAAHHEYKAVKCVSYAIEYLDESGTVLKKERGQEGMSKGASIMDSGSSLVSADADGPPEEANDARVIMTEVYFSARDVWKRPK